MERLKEDAARRAKLYDVLKKDLEQAMQDKAKAEKLRDDAVAVLTVRTQNDQKLKQICKDNEAKSKRAEAEMAAYKTESAKWLSELTLLNRDMDRKLSESSPSSSRFSFSWVNANINLVRVQRSLLGIA